MTHVSGILTEVHNRSRHNVLPYHILPPHDINIHLLRPYFLYSRLQWMVLPNSVQGPPGLLPYNLSGHPVLTPPHSSRTIQGVINHVSNPKISTAYTSSLKNIPNTCGVSPYCTNILNNTPTYYLPSLGSPPLFSNHHPSTSRSYKGIWIKSPSSVAALDGEVELNWLRLHSYKL